ncbi:DUF2278 family protein [Pleomorphomonas carboxyditropha]|uniref:LTD domain-containing protein n=1 Tax=Pleomorphomonas carboxyditropha TaxID=2023338 RepID=A0A2G9WRM6_9HYPH|nr:DUF2278 family protein [Pleomorphomonas carboxyditropha]PIO97368.1 hypothetical protein CJ014_20285 [Pleomorphomonas carboxyditropha]
MPLHRYSVLKGRPIHNRLGTTSSPHYQVQVSTGDETYRVAVNVRSDDGSEVEFLVRSKFEHPVTAGLAALDEGCHGLESSPGGLALDFIRSNVAQPWEFVPLPMSASGPDNDLNEKIDSYVQRAMADEHAMLYAYGDVWGPEPKADPYFGFKPGQGIHDIHFNQGNPPGKHDQDNGTFQDGALLFEFPADGGPSLWVGVFLKFKSQAWHSSDDAGAPIIAADPAAPGRPHAPIERDVIPALTVPDGLVRIIGALVNDVHSPERETVTLLNTSDNDVDLTGWAIVDRLKHRQLLEGGIAAGETRKIALDGGAADAVRLSNKGGLITLVNQDGVKVHGVSYTADEARQPGRTIPFQR